VTYDDGIHFASLSAMRNRREVDALFFGERRQASCAFPFLSDGLKPFVLRSGSFL